jgi:hypothetical protein
MVTDYRNDNEWKLKNNKDRIILLEEDDTVFSNAQLARSAASEFALPILLVLLAIGVQYCSLMK